VPRGEIPEANDLYLEWPRRRRDDITVGFEDNELGSLAQIIATDDGHGAPMLRHNLVRYLSGS
jgi:hypothetical protein